MAYWYTEFRADIKYLRDTGFPSDEACGKRIGVTGQTVRRWIDSEKIISVNDEIQRVVRRLAADLRSKLEKNNDEEVSNGNA